MTDDQNQVDSAQAKLRGAFVETALTNDQVARAIVEELQLGIADRECAFLGGLHTAQLDVPGI